MDWPLHTRVGTVQTKGPLLVDTLLELFQSIQENGHFENGRLKYADYDVRYIETCALLFSLQKKLFVWTNNCAAANFILQPFVLNILNTD